MTSARFQSHVHHLFNTDELRELVDECIEHLNRQCEDFTNSGSGWILTVVKSVNIHVAKFNPISASSYIKTPPFLARKLSIINV